MNVIETEIAKQKKHYGKSVNRKALMKVITVKFFSGRLAKNK